MAPHSSTLAWKIPWTEEPGRLQSMGSREESDTTETSLSLFTFMHWRRKWQLTPGLLPGKTHGWRSLVGCSHGVAKSWTWWATSLSLFTFMHWRRKWQPTPVFLPGESQGLGSLVGCHLWGRNRVGHNWNDLAAAAAATTYNVFCNTELNQKVLKCVWKHKISQIAKAI